MVIGNVCQSFVLIISEGEFTHFCIIITELVLFGFRHTIRNELPVDVSAHYLFSPSEND